MLGIQSLLRKFSKEPEATNVLAISNELKPLKWVWVSGKGIGIITSLQLDGSTVVDLIGANGETTFTIVENHNNIRIAKFSEIPQSRISHLTKLEAALLGYY